MSRTYIDEVVTKCEHCKSESDKIGNLYFGITLTKGKAPRTTREEPPEEEYISGFDLCYDCYLKFEDKLDELLTWVFNTKEDK